MDSIDSEERAAWIRLSRLPQVGPATARSLLASLGLPTAVFDASLATLQALVPEPVARALLAPPDEDTRAAIDEVERWLDGGAGRTLLTLADAAYPRGLLDIPDPPLLLYCIGRTELLNTTGFAIVGSRNASRQGLETAEQFAATLARAGLTIVSGLALGIDAAAHRGALTALQDGAAGNTIAVVGTGIDLIYPAGNRALTQRLHRDGLVVSEFPLATPPLTHNFPRRNRVISGLSRGVLVVEAALKSGSLITARIAAEQGREVFAIPGSIHSPMAKGCHRLIKDGAKLVESAQDVLEELRLPLRSVTRPAPSPVPLEPLSEAQAALLDVLGHDPLALDVLAQRSGQTPGALTAVLLELELAQYVERLPGNRYQRLR